MDIRHESFAIHDIMTLFKSGNVRMDIRHDSPTDKIF